MFAFGVLLLILPQLRHTQCRRKGEVPFLVYYTFKQVPHSSSVFWRTQEFASEGKRIECPSETLRSPYLSMEGRGYHLRRQGIISTIWRLLIRNLGCNSFLKYSSYSVFHPPLCILVSSTYTLMWLPAMILPTLLLELLA